jgi:hypothetical protein
MFWAVRAVRLGAFSDVGGSFLVGITYRNMFGYPIRNGPEEGNEAVARQRGPRPRTFHHSLSVETFGGTTSTGRAVICTFRLASP